MLTKINRWVLLPALLFERNRKNTLVQFTHKYKYYYNDTYLRCWQNE